MSDFVEATEGFEVHLSYMKTILKDKGFHLPILSSNMRNSRQISQSSLVRKGNIKQANQVNAFSSTVNGRLPTLIPIKASPYAYPDNDTQLNLNNEIYGTIRYAMDSTDVEHGNWVILYDKNFSSSIIKPQLEMFTDKKIICYPTDCEESSINELKDFIEFGCNSILLVERSLFLGCESRNVICITYDRFGSGEHLRGSLLRAVENLYLIYAFDDGFVYADASGFKVDGTFLKCGKKPTIAEYWNCKTCKQSFLCTSCKLICHHGHNLDIKTIFARSTPLSPFSISNYLSEFHDCNCNELNMCKLQNK